LINVNYMLSSSATATAKNAILLSYKFFLFEDTDLVVQFDILNDVNDVGYYLIAVSELC